MMRSPTYASSLSALSLCVGLAAGATAAEVETNNFYAGKQINLLVSTEVATTYDAYARIMADFWPRHIPGSPRFIVQNVPGASGLKLANHMFEGAPRDGLTVASTHSHIPTAPLQAPDSARYDPTKFSWIGNITKDPYVGLVWNTSPIQTFEDAKRIPSVMGGNGVASASTELGILSNAFFGTKFKIVSAYKGAPDVKLAIERGEIDGTFGTGWTSVKTGSPDWLTLKKVRILVQFGFEPHPELPGIPMFMDQVKSPEIRQALELQLARQEHTKPYFAPPEVPADRMAILRRGFDATMKDPQFRAALEKANLSIDAPMTAEQIAALTAKVFLTPPATVKLLQDTLAKGREGN